MNYRRLYFGSLRLCSLQPGDRLCVRGGQVLGAGCWEGQAAGRDRLLGGTGCWEDAKCFRDRLLCCLGTGCVCEVDRF